MQSRKVSLWRGMSSIGGEKLSRTVLEGSLAERPSDLPMPQITGIFA